MAMRSTVGQKTVGTTAVRITADATAQATKLQRGIRVSVSGSGKTYWGGSTVTTSNGFYINGATEIHPAEVDTIGDIYFISDTASQPVTVCVVGQVVTIS